MYNCSLWRCGESSSCFGSSLKELLSRVFNLPWWLKTCNFASSWCVRFVPKSLHAKTLCQWPEESWILALHHLHWDVPEKLRWLHGNCQIPTWHLTACTVECLQNIFISVRWDVHMYMVRKLEGWNVLFPRSVQYDDREYKSKKWKRGVVSLCAAIVPNEARWVGAV